MTAVLSTNLVGIKILSERLNIHTKTLYDWAETERIPHYKVGGKLLFSLEEIEIWIRGFKRGPSEVKRSRETASEMKRYDL